MRRLLFLTVTAILTISLSTCSDSGTGPDPGNGNDNNGGGGETTTYTVAVDVSPSDAGSISPSAEDIYDEDEEIELQANPNDGYVFTEWTGDIESTDNPHSLTVDQDYNITANFELKSYELTVNTEGEGTVSEEVLEQKSKDYEHGTVVELTANPAEGYKFVEWQGDVTGSENPAQITVDEAKSVTAVFEKKSYSLTVSTDGGGTVSKNPDKTEYKYNNSVELTATPSEGWKFVKWTRDISSTDNPLSVNMDANKDVSCVFEKKTFSLTVETSGEGSVTLNPDQGEYEYGAEIELSASATGDWVFDKWEGDVTGETNPTTVTLTNDKSVTALFENTLFAGGAGTEENPYQISTVNQLQAINELPSAHYVQINDIDASAITNFEPLGDEIIPFSGYFNGNDFTISNLTIERGIEEYVGLFGYSENSILKNINLTNVNILGHNYVGGIVGLSNSEIRKSKVTGKIAGQEYTGGLVGENKKMITESNAEATVEGIAYRGGNIGGITGRNTGVIKNSYFSGNIISEGTSSGGITGSNDGDGKISSANTSGTISGPAGVGGLVGINSSGEIENSSSNMEVSAWSRKGGLVGRNYGTISNSNSKGDVLTTQSTSASNYHNTGGLVGVNGGMVIDSYASGNVTGKFRTGGLVGKNQGEISNSNALGDVSGSDLSGGLIGENINGNIKKSFAEGKVMGGSMTGGLIGRSEDGSIQSSFAIGNVTGDDATGGLVGENQNTEIVNAYTKNNVDGNNEVGGLVGINRDNARILNSYTASQISGNTDIGGFIGTNGATIESSYWDTEYSNQTNAVGRGNSDGTTGLTTSEMTGTSAEANMSAFDWTKIWVTTNDYPALFWE